MYPDAHLEVRADQPAVIFANSDWTQSFGELDAAANRFRRPFRSTGLEPGGSIAICLKNHPRFSEVMWGCEYAELVYTAASARFTGEEVETVVEPVERPVDDDAAASLSAELIRFCRTQLADLKAPRSIDFREGLPRHPTGKLYKRLIKDVHNRAILGSRTRKNLNYG